MKKVSTKQAARNREVARLKALMPHHCVICGRSGGDAAHLLPKSIYPEYYTHPLNLVILCREHHRLYDDNVEFRRRQTKLFNQVSRFDEQAARRYFRL